MEYSQISDKLGKRDGGESLWLLFDNGISKGLLALQFNFSLSF